MNTDTHKSNLNNEKLFVLIREMKRISRWFQISCVFTSYFGKIHILSNIFSDGLKPPSMHLVWLKDSETADAVGREEANVHGTCEAWSLKGGHQH